MRVCQFRHFGTGIASGVNQIGSSSSLAKQNPSVKDRELDHPLQAATGNSANEFSFSTSSESDEPQKKWQGVFETS
jgi:hypothetical protein